MSEQERRTSNVTKDESNTAWQIDYNFNPERSDYYNTILNSYDKNEKTGELTPKKGSEVKASADTIQNKIQKKLLSEADLKEIYGPNNVATFQPTYDRIFLARLHDNIRRDGATFRSLLFFVTFALGADISLIPKLTRAFANNERTKAKVDELANNETYMQLLDDLAEVDRTVDLKTNLEDLLFNGLAVGHSVLVKKTNSAGLVETLLPLSSFSLGNVYVDKRNWNKILAIQYKDFDPEGQVLLAEDIIHFIPYPYHTTPWKKWFGHSILEPLVSITNSNRVTYEIAIPEVSKRAYAPTQVINTNLTNPEKIQELQMKLDPMKTVVWNGPEKIEHQVINPQVDIMSLIEKGKSIDEKVFRDTTVPKVVGFADENRSVAHYSLNQWTVSTLAHIRSRLDQTLDPEYYMPNTKAILKMRNINATEMQLMNSIGQTPLYLETLNQNRQQIIESDIPVPFRVGLLVKNITFDPFVETSAGVIGLVQNNIISWDIALEILGLEKYIERMQSYKDENSLMNNQILTMDQQMAVNDQQQGNVQGTKTSTAGQQLGSRTNMPNVNRLASNSILDKFKVSLAKFKSSTTDRFTE